MYDCPPSIHFQNGFTYPIHLEHLNALSSSKLVAYTGSSSPKVSANGYIIAPKGTFDSFNVSLH